MRRIEGTGGRASLFKGASLHVTVTRTGLVGAGDWLAGYLSGLWVLVRVWRQRRRIGHGA